jgi:KUP system potassium uptake protein
VGIVFLVVDLAFLGANLLKVMDGGWVPLAIAASIYALMSTWKQGRRVLAARLKERAYPLDHFLRRMTEEKPVRVPGTAVFMTGNPGTVPHPLLHNLEHNKVLHEQVVLLTVTTSEAPHVPRPERAKVQRVADNMYRVTLTFGFMDDPDVPKALHRLPRDSALRIDLSETTFFLGLETLLSTARPGMSRWREKLFAYMSRNARRATAFFRIPPDRVVEIGIHLEL